MQSGASYMQVYRSFGEPVLNPVFDTLYKYVHTGLALNGLQHTKDLRAAADLKWVPKRDYNLDAALNLHCGALCVMVESPNHGFSVGKNEAGEVALHTPEMLLDAHLICHQEAMTFLVETGGRSKWTPGRKRKP